MINKVFTEDGKIDLVYPANQSSFVINSNGSLINGFIEIAKGKGPHRTILLLHGIPGTEKNTDMAHVFCRAGFNVAIFSYRGSWGSKGDYSFKNCLVDVSNVIIFLQDHAEEYRCRKNDIILIGYSLGGFLALYSAYLIDFITNVASISGFYLNYTKNLFEKEEHHREIIYTMFTNSMNPLNGTTPETLINEILSINTWNFENFFEKLRTKNLCLIAGLKDDIVPAEYYHLPLIHDLENFTPKTKIKLAQTTFHDSNHTYSDHRIKLTKYLLEWLSKT